MSASTALRSGVFWWSAALFALMVGVSQGWSIHIVAYLGGIGVEELRGAQFVAVQNVIGVPAALALGAMADRVGVTPLLLVMLLTVGGGFGLFATEPPEVVAGLLCGVFGIAFGGVLPVYMVLLGQRLPADALGRVSPALCARHGVVPLESHGRRITVAMHDPLDLRAIDDVQFQTGCRASAVITSNNRVARS